MVTNFRIDKAIIKELKILLLREDKTISDFLRECIDKKIKESKVKSK
jgi:predicted DNA-binding protein